MTWADLRSLRSAGVELGAHSLSHPELDVISSKQARREISASREHLEDGLDLAVRSFAYPHGYHSRSVIKITRESGYDSACAVKDRWSEPDDDAFALSRLIIDGGTTAEQLESLLRNPPARQPREQRVLRLAWRTTRRAKRKLRRAA